MQSATLPLRCLARLPPAPHLDHSSVGSRRVFSNFGSHALGRLAQLHAVNEQGANVLELGPAGELHSATARRPNHPTCNK